MKMNTKRIIYRYLRQFYSLTNYPHAISQGALAEPPLAIMSTITKQPVTSSNKLKSILTAAAAAAATLVLAANPVFCEQSYSSKGAADDNGHVDAVTVRQALHDLWTRLEEQLHRLDASSDASLPHIPQPEVDINQGTVSVQFQVPQSLNIAGAELELRRHLLASPSETSPLRRKNGFFSSASTSETSSSGPDGVARRLRRSSADPLDSITVDIMEPYDADRPAVFEFKGACTRRNLALLESVMLSAAQPVSMNRSRRGGGGGDGRRRSPPLHAQLPFWLDKLDADGADAGGLDKELEAGLEQFFAPLRDLMHEFEKLHGEHHHRWDGLFEGGGGGGGEDGSLRKPQKRFDDLSPEEEEEGPQRVQQQSGESSLPRGHQTDPRTAAAIRKLRDMGCQVFLPHPQQQQQQQLHHQDSDATTTATTTAPAVVDWGQLAGYEDQKQAIEESLLLPLLRPDVYDSVARGTRKKFASNRPRAVLFIGPPGTGKTSSARVIASQAAVPLVYIPLEALVSKWYGESEKSLATALEAADSLPDGCIVFLDELDALATSRSGEMHEATRRLLGVLLRHMDGFDSKKRSVVVGATNRPMDLDPALLSRFSATVEFGLPREEDRRKIVLQYAQHLSEVELGALAAATPGMAGRDLRDVCEQAERRWAAKIIRGQAPEGDQPPLKEYLDAANARLREMGNAMQ